MRGGRATLVTPTMKSIENEMADPIEPASTDTVEYRREGDIGYITLTRPERLNAVTKELYLALRGGLQEAQSDGVRVIVLEGEGRAFCAGADMKAHSEHERTPAEKRAYAWAAQHACRAIHTHDRPVIAKVHGYAIGAGAELALSADLLVMADDAEIRFPEVRIGTYVGGGVTYTLPARVGVAKAKELILTGATVTADEAANIDLVNQTVDADDLEKTVGELATRIAENAPVPVGFAKEHLNRHPKGYDDALAGEVDALLTCMDTDDWQEGVDAFAEDRNPSFEGT